MINYLSVRYYVSYFGFVELLIDYILNKKFNMISEKWKRGFSKARTSSGGNHNKQKVKESFTSTNTISEEESKDMEVNININI